MWAYAIIVFSILILGLLLGGMETEPEKGDFIPFVFPR